MKRSLISLLLYCLLVLTSVAALAQPTAPAAVTFAINYDTARIAQLQALGLPLPPFPHLDVFIADNLSNNTVKYEVTVAYMDVDGKPQTATEFCKASKTPYDNAGNTVSYCSIGVNAVNGAQITIQALIAQTSPATISVLP